VQQPLLDETDGTAFDEDIVEGTRERIVAKTFDELDYRRTAIGESYPFLVDTAKQTMVFQSGDEGYPGRPIYLFCLLASAIRSGQIQGGDELEVIKRDIANNFQVCACLAAGGFVAGSVCSFGFPRATGDAFLPALRNAFARFGAGMVRTEIPDGLPGGIKDGGMDVIAWRDFPDRMPGKLYLLGQAASGMNWNAKSVLERIPQFHGTWFTEAPAKHATPAMFIPFPLQQEMDEPERDPFAIAVSRRFWSEEQRFGIIFDRIRIPYLANLCLTSLPEARQNVDGADKVHGVIEWVDRSVALFRTKEADA
jgi:hypothetical protein